MTQATQITPPLQPPPDDIKIQIVKEFAERKRGFEDTLASEIYEKNIKNLRQMLVLLNDAHLLQEFLKKISPSDLTTIQQLLKFNSEKNETEIISLEEFKKKFNNFNQLRQAIDILHSTIVALNQPLNFAQYSTLKQSWLGQARTIAENMKYNNDLQKHVANLIDITYLREYRPVKKTPGFFQRMRRC